MKKIVVALVVVLACALAVAAKASAGKVVTATCTLGGRPTVCNFNWYQAYPGSWNFLNFANGTGYQMTVNTPFYTAGYVTGCGVSGGGCMTVWF